MQLPVLRSVQVLCRGVLEQVSKEPVKGFSSTLQTWECLCSYMHCYWLLDVTAKLWNYKEQSKCLKNAPKLKKPFDAAFAKILTYNTVLEAISKQANCCSRQLTGWRGSALSYKQHRQLYLEKEIKPKSFVSKYANKVIFLFKTITRLKVGLVGLDKSSHARLHVCCPLTGTSSKAQPKPHSGCWSRERLRLRKKPHEERITAAHKRTQLFFSSSSN